MRGESLCIITSLQISSLIKLPLLTKLPYKLPLTKLPFSLYILEEISVSLG